MALLSLQEKRLQNESQYVVVSRGISSTPGLYAIIVQNAYLSAGEHFAFASGEERM